MWPDDLSVLGSAEGTRSLRRRRKVKRMAVDPPAEPEPPLATMLGPPPVPKARIGSRPHRVGAHEGRPAMEMCRVGLLAAPAGGKNRVKKRKLAPNRMGPEAADEGVVVESEDLISSPTEGSKDKMELEEQKGSDEDMSDRWLVCPLFYFSLMKLRLHFSKFSPCGVDSTDNYCLICSCTQRLSLYYLMLYPC